ncbi:MAG TPA: DUF2007 domain-containing protein [Prolixibacteraceae bacterium]|nr:DUF2007 domain-containing protein [Prolixibacteraceae bacterium]
MKNGDNLVRVYTGNEVSVIHLKEELEEEGISVMFQNDFQSGISAGFVGGVPTAIDVYIRQGDMAKAEPILADFIKKVGD